MIKLFKVFFESLGKAVKYCLGCFEDHDRKLSWSRVMGGTIIFNYLFSSDVKLTELTWINIAFPILIYSINVLPQLAEKFGAIWVQKQGG